MTFQSWIKLHILYKLFPCSSSFWMIVLQANIFIKQYSISYFPHMHKLHMQAFAKL
jgi:hypothetical protein